MTVLGWPEILILGACLIYEIILFFSWLKGGILIFLTGYLVTLGSFQILSMTGLGLACLLKTLSQGKRYEGKPTADKGTQK